MDAVSPRQHRRARIDPDFFGLRFDAKDAVHEVEQFVVALTRMCLDRPVSVVVVVVVVVVRRPSLLPPRPTSYSSGFSKREEKNGKKRTRARVVRAKAPPKPKEREARGDAGDGDEDEDNARARASEREGKRA